MQAAGYDDKTIDFLFNTGNAALKALNWPAEKMEQSVGTAAAFGEAWLPSLPYRILGYEDMYDEYVKSNKDVQYLQDHLADVWETARLTYDIAATTGLGGAITRLPARTESVLDMLSQGKTDVQLTGLEKSTP